MRLVLFIKQIFDVIVESYASIKKKYVAILELNKAFECKLIQIMIVIK